MDPCRVTCNDIALSYIVIGLVVGQLVRPKYCDFSYGIPTANNKNVTRVVIQALGTGRGASQYPHASSCHRNLIFIYTVLNTNRS